MAINKTTADRTQLYKRALSAEEKKRMQAITASQKEQTSRLPEQARALASAGTQAAAQQGGYQRRQAQAKTTEQTAAAPVRMKDYTWWSWMGSNDMTTMSDRDKADWNAAMQGWQNGDYSSYNDNFRKAGNWSSYVDDNGRVSGMLRYVGDGIGGYVPVNGGQLLQNGFSGDMSNYAFYGPNGEVYTADAKGNLTLSGTWTRQEPYSALKESVPYKMLKGTATEEEREEWIKGLSPYEPEQKNPKKPEQTVPEKTTSAQETGPSRQTAEDGERQSGRIRPAEKPAPAPSDRQPAGRSDGGIDWQSYVDKYDYGAAPEWEGSEYQRRRDEALRRAEDMRWSYDPDADPVWQAYQKQYRREGQRAAQDALGQYAAMTGGLPSSYAVTAASQAGDYYAAQLSDKLPELYQNAYERYLQEYQRQLGLSDRYAEADDAEYDRYRDRLGQWNTDRDFRYGLNRDAVEDARYADETAYDRAWNEEDRDYTREYQARRDAISDARYDREWAQELREYADAQGWKALDWQQYLREYGDQLSEKERQWAYQMARDAESDRRYAKEWDADQEQAAYQRSQAENKLEYERGRDALSDERYDTQWQQSLREYEDEREQQAWNNAYKMLTAFGSIVTQDMADALGMPLGTTLEQYRAATGSGGGGGRSSGGSKSEAEVTASGSRYDESGRRTGVWQDADGDTYNGYHPDGQWKSRGYDAAWNSVQFLAQTGAGKEKVLTKIRSLVEQDKITDYEAEMMLVNLGYRGTSAGTGRNTIGPNSVQMVQ